VCGDGETNVTVDSSVTGDVSYARTYLHSLYARNSVGTRYPFAPVRACESYPCDEKAFFLHLDRLIAIYVMHVVPDISSRYFYLI